MNFFQGNVPDVWPHVFLLWYANKMQYIIPKMQMSS